MDTPLEYGKYYHIYNRGNNSQDIFIESADYIYFLKLYHLFISSVADTMAWCLMTNHFHFFIRIKDIKEIGFLNPENRNGNIFEKWKTFFTDKNEMLIQKPLPASQLKHLFSTYSLFFNKKYNRSGALFNRMYRRNEVDCEQYFTRLVVYINSNPVHHNICERIEKYHWSSYRTMLSESYTNLKREEVLKYFEDVQNFIFVHHEKCKQAESFEDWEEDL